MSWLLLAIGFAGLVVGGDALVRGASALARRLGVAPLVIGLTVVAFGTSAPELAATVAAGLRGVPELGIGNVLGSNVANVALILAAAALIAPIPNHRAFLVRDLPVSLLAMGVLLLLSFDRGLGRLDGAVLLALLVIYLAVLMRSNGAPALSAVSNAPDMSVLKAAAWAVFGIGLLVAGAEATVRGAVDIAASFGVSDRVIGLTVVAFGTSLPELAASLAAAYRRQGDMILGNIAGSNVFNVLAVLGAASLATPLPVSTAVIAPDVAVAVAATLLLVPFMAFRGRLGRSAGALLLLGYAGYVAWLFAAG